RERKRKAGRVCLNLSLSPSFLFIPYGVFLLPSPVHQASWGAPFLPFFCSPPLCFMCLFVHFLAALLVFCLCSPVLYFPSLSLSLSPLVWVSISPPVFELGGAGLGQALRQQMISPGSL